MYKPSEKEMPKDWEKQVENMMSSNRDGAGFMYYLKGRIYFEKGFRTKEGVIGAIKRISEKVDMKSTAFAFHARIGTSGKTNEKHTHPFPITNRFDTMEKLSGSYDYLLMHNGIFGIFNDRKNEVSDTMIFCKNVLSNVIKDEAKYASARKFIELFIKESRSKVIIFTSKFIYKVGNWIEDEGIFYSNDGYKTKAWSYGDYSGVYPFRDYDYAASYFKKNGTYEYDGYWDNPKNDPKDTRNFSKDLADIDAEDDEYAGLTEEEKEWLMEIESAENERKIYSQVEHDEANAELSEETGAIPQFKPVI
jgi:hypothetical protein